MALALDASTPALAAASNDPWTSASFTPPVDSLLVVVVLGDGFNAVPTHTVTSTGLTFASEIKAGGQNQGIVEIFTAEVGANGGSARTVSVSTNATSDVGGVKVYVFTGYDTTTIVADTGSAAGSTTNNITPVVTQPLVDNTWTVGGAVEWQSLGVPTSTDVEEGFDDADLSLMCVRKSAATGAAGDVTMNFDAAGTGTPLWTWAAVAIRPAAGQQAAMTTVTETDTAQLLGKRKQAALPIVLATDTAQTVGRRKIKALGAALETDTAQAITVSGPAPAMSPALETNFSMAIGKRKQQTPAFVTETDTARPLGRVKRRTLGVALEVDTARFVGEAEPINHALETDQPQPLGRRKVRAIGTAFETNVALEITRFIVTKIVVFPTYKERLGVPRLLSRYTKPEPVSLIKKAGVWSEIVSPHQDEISAAEGFYQGGHRHVLTEAEAADLPPQYVEEIS